MYLHTHTYICSLNNYFYFLFVNYFFFFFSLENRNTGVVFGAILGAILGASLLTLVGYLLCGKKKTSSFSHRRLYDDRNEPGKNNFQDFLFPQWFQVSIINGHYMV